MGLVTAVLAVALLLLLGLSDGKAASWATTVVAAVALLGALQANRMGREGWAFLGTAVTIALSVATYFIMLFPNVCCPRRPAGVQPHHRERLELGVHAQGDDDRRPDLHSARAALPGLDVLGLPEALDHQAHSR